MRKESGTRWQRRGSSIVFGPEALSPLLTSQCLVSLRTLLGWLEDWPDDPPDNGNTVLVGGLESCLELYTPEEAESFLRSRVRPVVEEFQSRWDQRGLVFGFGKPSRSFQLAPASDEMTYITNGASLKLTSSSPKLEVSTPDPARRTRCLLKILS